MVMATCPEGSPAKGLPSPPPAKRRWGPHQYAIVQAQLMGRFDYRPGNGGARSTTASGDPWPLHEEWSRQHLPESGRG